MKEVLKKLFRIGTEERCDDEVKIVNGKIIGYNYEKRETGKDEETAECETIKEDKKEIIDSENIEKKETIIEEVCSDSEIEIESELFLEGENEVEKSRGRTRKIDGFYLTLQAAGRAKRTIEGYKSDMRFWESVAKNRKTTLYNLKLKEIEESIAKLDINTSRRHVSALKQLAKWYLRDGFPMLHIEVEKLISGKGKARIPKAKSEEEFKKIREEAKRLIGEGEREGIWLGLFIMCGLRISEIQTIVPGDDYITVIGKGNKERKIPASDWILDALKNAQVDGRGGYRQKKSIIDRYLRKKGYSNLHSLRHTYATTLLHKGVPIQEIQILLGHASISTTQIYAKTQINKEVINVLEG